MTTTITMSLSNKEAIYLNNIWFEMFGKYTNIDSMDNIKSYITSRESGEYMIIETKSGNININLNLEHTSFIKILAGIEHMHSDNVHAESIRQVIRNFIEVFGENSIHRLCIDGVWMCESNSECNYEEGNEYKCICEHYSKKLRSEGYDEDYIEANLIDYVSCRIYGSKLFMQTKNSYMAEELHSVDSITVNNDVIDFKKFCKD